MLSSIARRSSQFLRVSFLRRRPVLARSNGEHINTGVFADRERALENRDVWEHEQKLIKELREELKKKEQLLERAEKKVQEVTGKDYSAAADAELDKLMAVKRDLLKKLRDLEEEELKLRQQK